MSEQPESAPQAASQPAAEAPAAPAAGPTLDDLCREDRKLRVAEQREKRRAAAEERRQKQAAKKAQEKGQEKGGVHVQLKPTGTVTIEGPAPQRAAEASLYLVSIRGLPPGATQDQVTEIVTAVASVAPLSVRLGREIRVGFKTERKAQAFCEGLNGRHCKETGQTISCRVLPPKRSTITIK